MHVPLNSAPSRLWLHKRYSPSGSATRRLSSGGNPLCPQQKKTNDHFFCSPGRSLLLLSADKLQKLVEKIASINYNWLRSRAASEACHIVLSCMIRCVSSIVLARQQSTARYNPSPWSTQSMIGSSTTPSKLPDWRTTSVVPYCDLHAIHSSHHPWLESPFHHEISLPGPYLQVDSETRCHPLSPSFLLLRLRQLRWQLKPSAWSFRKRYNHQWVRKRIIMPSTDHRTDGSLEKVLHE